MDVDRRRALSFGAVAADYARYRPGYPRAGVQWALRPVLGGAPPRLLDLGAGTGKLTAAMREFGSVVAVDPDEGMLDELRSRFPDVDVRSGSAEDIPVPDSSVDAVLVGQAWHWFDHERALGEIARVLRSGGALAVLWNSDDADVEWVAGYIAVCQNGRRVPPARAHGSQPALPGHPAFTASEFSTHRNPFPITADGLVANVATHSWILVSEPEEREHVLGELRAYLAGRAETSAGEFELPLVTEALRALRK